MPTDKRQRQRAQREAQREARLAAERRRRTRNRILAGVVIAALLLGTLAVFAGDGGDGGDDVTAGSTTTTAAESEAAAEFGTTPCPPKDGAAERTAEFEAPFERCIEESVDYRAVVETDAGSFTIDLLEEKAPATVNNFVALARHRAYEDVPFHRVIPGFVVQGGDVQKQNGTGGPGYQFADELPAQGEYEIGSVAMANSGPDTNGSQFFVVTGEQGVQLPPQYSLFGKVIDGLDVVKKIEADGSPSGTPSTVHTIKSVTIEEA